MKTVLILGAGRSSPSLIFYLLKYAATHPCQVLIGDLSPASAAQRLGDVPGAAIIPFDIVNREMSWAAIQTADIVISMLPPKFHPEVGRMCVAAGAHLLTASYVTDEMQSLDEAAKAKSVLLLNECGLDPGIDHMSAMQVIDRIHAQGGHLFSFESFTGGLIDPVTDKENPWRYRFTWNSRNVVMAGQGTAKFLENGKLKYIPYQRLFREITPVTVPDLGSFEGYANRDSLGYIQAYGLKDIHTMLRGTLRFAGFCSAWNVFVQLGCCDDTYVMENISNMTHIEFIRSFLPSTTEDVITAISQRMVIDEQGPEIQKLKWSGFLDDTLIGMDRGTPAQIMEHILNKKWRMQETHHDLVVMWHRFRYTMEGKNHEIQASLVAHGKNSIQTAMAETVGLPLAIAAKLLIEGKITRQGVAIPTEKEIYEPVLTELRALGIELTERSR